MKKSWIAKLAAVLCLTMGITLVPVNQLSVQAAEVIATVEGTVLSETTQELLHLSTKEGKMEIKLDSNTDASGCKLLLTGEKISVSVSHGSDGYLHAVKISSDVKTPGISIDSSTTATVTGVIDAKSNSEILFFDTQYGEMELKLDATTDISGCTMLVAGKTYEISCARGSDAYMHALTIKDSSATVKVVGGTTVNVSTLTPAPASTLDSSVVTMSVSGTVSDKTKENLLYLDTKEGEMQFVIDSKTDSRNGLVLVPDTKLTITFYHGSDAYLHAAVIKGESRNALSATLDHSSEATVTGTVLEKTTENKLFLDTRYGEMELKMDALDLDAVKGCKVLVEDKKITITCERGSDAYMHVTGITGA